MSPIHPLGAEQLSRRSDPTRLRFETTAELEPLDRAIGQDRALEALQFGVSMRAHDFHIFAFGAAGVGKREAVRSILVSRAKREPTPPDWCYVHNFASPQRPRCLSLPAGRGRRFRDDMRQLVEELIAAIPAALETEEFRTRKDTIESEAKRPHEDALQKLAKDAGERQLALIRTPVGIALAPVKDGEVVSPDDFEKLPEDDKKRLAEAMKELEKVLESIIRRIPEWEKERRSKVRALVREVTTFAVGHLIGDVRARFADLPAVVAHLEEAERDIVENAAELIGGAAGGPEEPGFAGRYRVNLLVDHAGTEGAPVIYEDHPTHRNLIGRVEHHSVQGALLTHFGLLRAGALHRASGGYLILDAVRVLSQPFAYDALKRALRAREVRIESLGDSLGLVSTQSLEPESIPLSVKVVLIGDRMVYYLLSALDPDFGDLFKVGADFGEDLEWTDASAELYARLVATLVRQHELLPLERDAVARVIEHAARRAEHSSKLSVDLRDLTDLLREADHFAKETGKGRVDRSSVDRALEARIRRRDRIRERAYELIQRGTVLIDTTGAKVGQINALSVIDVGGFAFGRPSRITARTRLGKGQVLDIEREVELGGPIHSKGLLILQSFLSTRYAADQPLSLSASVVFEQSYSGVEGDSASSAELYALLSSLAEVPLGQSIAVTGSVSQMGQVQAIGGVNEKIEGFFDVCRLAGLTGQQGVLIPRANVQNLMLRPDVVAAVKEERFRIYAVTTVDEGIEVLTGLPAGERDAEGRFPEGSVNHRVERKLLHFAEQTRRFAQDAREGRSP